MFELVNFSVKSSPTLALSVQCPELVQNVIFVNGIYGVQTFDNFMVLGLTKAIYDDYASILLFIINIH